VIQVVGLKRLSTEAIETVIQGDLDPLPLGIYSAEEPFFMTS
jgi:hypothetical protein